MSGKASQPNPLGDDYGLYKMDIQSHFHLFEAKFATTNVQLVRGKGEEGKARGLI